MGAVASGRAKRGLNGAAGGEDQRQKAHCYCWFGPADKAWDYRKGDVAVDVDTGEVLRDTGDSDAAAGGDTAAKEGGSAAAAAAAPASGSSSGSTSPSPSPPSRVQQQQLLLDAQRLYLRTPSQRGFGPRGPIEFDWEVCMKRLPFSDRLQPVVYLAAGSCVTLLEPGEPPAY